MTRPLPVSRRPLPRRAAWLAVTLALAVLTCGCGPQKPARLVLDPAEGMKFYSKGKTGSINASAYDDKDKPFMRPPKLAWSSSDETVVTVDENGKVTSTGSGTAKVTAETAGVSQSTEVRVMILGKIEFSPDMPTEYKAAPETRLPIMLIVTDDKGRVMEQHRKVTYDDTSGCIDVYQDGTFAAYRKGECSIVAKLAGMEASFRVKVK